MRGPLVSFGLILFCISSGISIEGEPTPSECEIYYTLCEGHSRIPCYSLFLEACRWNFQTDMDNVSASDWCMWDKVKGHYNKFTVCSENAAECMTLPWPNRLVEDTFVEIHSLYFQECPTETLRDPPPNVIFALVMTPICLIPAMVVLVVLKTKNGDRTS